MRKFSTLTRLAAVTAAASLMMAQPAPAQPRQPEAGSGPVPPPVDMTIPLVPDTQKPPADVTYEPKSDCVSSLNDGKVVLPNKPWGQQRLQIEEAHKFATGKNQMVAVIDTGVRPHPFFENRVVKGPDYVAAKNDAFEDCDGHGTEVAGIIAARSPNTNEIGFTGVAPDAKILAIRQSSDVYKGKRPPTAETPNPQELPAGDLNTLAQAIRNAADNPQVTVINMSVDNCRASTFSISRPEQELQRALRYAVDKDKVVVASAGNQSDICTKPRNGVDSNKPEFIITPPWFADDVLSVAAVNRQGNLAPFSMQGPWVSVAGPGTEIISLDPSGSGLANQTVLPNRQRSLIQGTSFAAPYVAGLAALVRERYPSLKAREVMNRIKQTAQHPAAPGGRDNLVGYGMVNPIAALTAMIPAEYGIPADKAERLPATMPPVKGKDWSAMNVALIGTGGGILVLLTTLFVMHAIRRTGARREPEES